MPSTVMNVLFFLSLFLCFISTGSSQFNISLNNKVSFTHNTSLMTNHSSMSSLFEMPQSELDYIAHHSGYCKISDNEEERMFYYLFDEKTPPNSPVVLWLNGEMGLSSTTAIFLENGPFRIDGQSLKLNDYSWHTVAKMLYVDEPLGAGFSYTNSYKSTQTEIVNDLYNFLQVFFHENDRFVNNDFFICGQSYAGSYGSVLASHIYDQNRDRRNIRINLKGLAIGNGLIHPEIQFKSIPSFLKTNEILLEDQEAIEELSEICQTSIEDYDENDEDMDPSLKAHNDCDNLLAKIYDSGKNLYDYEASFLDYDYSHIGQFMNSLSVQRALGVGFQGIKEFHVDVFNNAVFEALKAELMKNGEDDVIYLLNNKINVLIYAGDRDIKFNPQGILDWLNDLRWNQNLKHEFKAKKFGALLVDKDMSIKGTTKTYGPVSYCRIYNAGHKVSMDQPAAALAMFEKWIARVINA